MNPKKGVYEFIEKDKLLYFMQTNQLIPCRISDDIILAYYTPDRKPTTEPISPFVPQSTANIPPSEDQLRASQIPIPKS